MIIELRNPTRTMEFEGPMTVSALLAQLDLRREGVLVIREGTLVPGDDVLGADDRIEIRSVISGGAW